MFQRLLVCTDFSDGLHRLVNFVPSLAATGVQQLTFLHCVPLIEDRSVPREDAERIAQAQERLRPALEQVPAGVDVQVKVRSGQPVDGILQVAKAQKSDLIVLGTPPRNLLSEKLLGSTLMEVLQRCTIPLMSLRPQLISTFTSEELDLRCRHLFRHILVPYNGSPAAKHLLSQLKHTLNQAAPQALERIHLCWVVEGLRRHEVSEQYRVDAAQKELAIVKAELEAFQVKVEPVEIRLGEPIPEVLDLAQMADVSAIVITSDHPNKLLEWSVPSFNKELLRQSWHPIICFPMPN